MWILMSQSSLQGHWFNTSEKSVFFYETSNAEGEKEKKTSKIVD